ncbi:MAG: deoxyribose-phosphate aldolase [Desulfuromonas sp.]|nr:MAG: deoxyribose-phosphate aldolase [Desulfuromonas sp.]
MNKSPACFIDHTLLRPDSTHAEIDRLCEEAVEYSFAAICVPPLYVEHCRRRLYGSNVALSTVVGFPCGFEPSRIKALQTAEAIGAGAGEIDMVIPLGAARQDQMEVIADDVRQVVAAADGRPVKAIIECCLFDDAHKRRLVEAVVKGGAAYVKTSTGFSSGGATVADVTLLVEVAAGRIKVKAAGGIRNWPDCAALLEAGAQRIGTSAGVAIMQEWYRQLGPTE